MSKFRSIECRELDFNVFNEIGERMLLITASDEKNGRINAMTASWGTMGILWNKPVCILFIRPQRYTKELVDSEGSFSVNVLEPGHKQAYAICGSLSGRDNDKIAMSGLNPVMLGRAQGFDESQLVLEVKKLYTDTLKAGGFLGKEELGHYKDGDFHDVYVCEIVSAYLKEEN